MPIYEYFCRTCSTKYDKLRPMRDADAPINCPTCHEENSIRMLSLVIMHSGSGKSSVDSAEPPAPQSHVGCGCGNGTCGCH